MWKKNLYSEYNRIVVIFYHRIGAMSTLISNECRSYSTSEKLEEQKVAPLRVIKSFPSVIIFVWSSLYILYRYTSIQNHSPTQTLDSQVSDGGV